MENKTTNHNASLSPLANEDAELDQFQETALSLMFLSVSNNLDKAEGDASELKPQKPQA